ncbi:hypothetical protein LRP31_13240 [Mesorhizobium mediterraneum]|uniref:hypothetical protein n=1 Tax=Mesorhizobium TaxID=68287 RepID=UPI000FD3F925|nr:MULTISPECIES: hypothetical protein [Mesorhizobium]RUV01146.1 hypothetical protein EOB36_14345 [Mesorhizobium sp. M6A.T.Cr.TU.017.01.1.1]RWN33825.1 MAG: hypothetical protein EOR96_28055 [Mesorhizobium sp.]RWP03498.1 MAG: hypothetical protein EOQ98_00455 [Mesorhizobium sp.]TIM33613.1 MAG: hypothetical protein E5Y69_22810 [Mesorhizobium sp.]WIW56048.1 hypothetical protein LRP31_13240 [Mesorhizobium mediterraneum]
MVLSQKQDRTLEGGTILPRSVRDKQCDPPQHATLQGFHAIGAAVGQRRVSAFFREVLFFAEKRTI